MMMIFFVCILFFCLQNEVSAKSNNYILKMNIGSLRRNDGKPVVLEYIDMPFDMSSTDHLVLNCKIPLVGARYHWKLDAKIGSPEVGSIGLGDVKNPTHEWERTVSFSSRVFTQVNSDNSTRTHQPPLFRVS